MHPGCDIDEKHGIVDVEVLTKFCKKQLEACLISRWKRSVIADPICHEIYSSVQSVALIVELDHGSVDADVIRTDTAGWL